MTSLRRPRTLVVATAALALAAALAGCSATNPIQTEDHYDASDGVSAALGDITAVNLMVLSAAEGEPGVLHGALTNHADDSITVTITFGDVSDPTGATAAPDASSETVDVAAGATVLLDGTDDDGHADVRTEATTAPAGAVTPITLSTQPGGTLAVQVPVLDGTLPQYSPAPTS
ncbi:hypothetical protein [Cellulomonas composti]|uniref:Lipoprotein n=1 Tax=Cellulomonas composti TaxID=266130 RepID=A0A511JCN8_9CELL|nr:hypothetical protein [Cellulomonas composti]GEL95744.1 hypothetical protein CCO02nite_24020 [Cellulomonas composti]